MSHTLTCLHTHVVFSTKERKPTITPEMKPNLLAYMGGIVRELEGKATIINGTADHVHMLLQLPPVLSLSDCMRLVKTNSSRWAHEHGHKRLAWQTGFSGFSVSTSTLPAVTAYIRDQERHHRKLSFQEELRLLLQRHGISFDERYILGLSLTPLKRLSTEIPPTPRLTPWAAHSSAASRLKAGCAGC